MNAEPLPGGPSLAGESPYSQAVRLAGDLVRTLAPADIRAKDLAHRLALRRSSAISSDIDLALDLAEAVGHLHVAAVRLPAVIGRPRAVAARTAYLVKGLAYAATAAGGLALQLDRVDPRGSAQARRVARACGEAMTLLDRFTTALHSPEEAAAPRTARRRVSPTAQWLIGSAARVLPAADRSRYVEEWGGELWDLAAEPRRRHLVHALRIAVHAWSTRRAVLSARRDDGGEEW
ncbi:hypothetical protein ABZ322_33055 [Streptomyces sp. NPDC006129]|uniref:hypothetical protein n=1 Tax=unclassified Streptomyces TaxID=2593676 RepID=UPI003323DE2D